MICDRTISLATRQRPWTSCGRVLSDYGVHRSSIVLFAGRLLWHDSSSSNRSYGEKFPPRRGLLCGAMVPSTRTGSAATPIDAVKTIKYILGSNETRETESPTGLNSHP